MGQIVKTIGEAKNVLMDLRGEGASRKTVVFTNGCFDLLHPGHIHSLCAAKKLGDLLVVGINSDESVKGLKGLRRPLFPLEFRTQMLAALESVDLVVPFEGETPVGVIEVLQPDVLAKGGDYTDDEIAGASFVKGSGGRVELIPFLEGWSTSDILADILERYSTATEDEDTPVR